MQLVYIISFILHDFLHVFCIEQNPTIQKPVAQHPPIKTNKATAPSVVGKVQTKVNSYNS
jgi:hypothetical protein